MENINIEEPTLETDAETWRIAFERGDEYRVYNKLTNPSVTIEPDKITLQFKRGGADA